MKQIEKYKSLIAKASSRELASLIYCWFKKKRICKRYCVYKGIEDCESKFYCIEGIEKFLNSEAVSK